MIHSSHTQHPLIPQQWDGDFEQGCVNALRVLSIDTVQQANSGHPGLPLGAAPLAYVLWTRYLRHYPTNPHWTNRDRFVLSAGHGSALLYSLLYLTGYDLPLEELKRFRQWESRAPGHPEHGLTPGVETTTGPLGQGFANGVGFAIAERFLAAHFNRPGYDLVDHHTYGIVGDGDLMEGVSAEAASLAGHLGLGKLIYFYDQNSISLAGSTDLSFSENVVMRFAAYGWHVEEVEDGNDLNAIDVALQHAHADEQHPSLICVRTHIGYGSPHKQDTCEAHGSPLGHEEVRLTRQRLGWPFTEPFYVPEEIVAYFREALTRGAKQETAWNALFEAYHNDYPLLADEYERASRGDLPDQWDARIPTFTPDDGPLSTRKASGKVLASIADTLWNLVGGSADLNTSTYTALSGKGDFQSPTMPSFKTGSVATQGTTGGAWGWSGQNIHFGVREHAMGAILNGMALHGGVIAYGATFFVFSDYMRPSMRLAALMKLGIKYVFTHDSLAVGEDGPTHQPIEQLAALRAIPGLIVIRPADANEVAHAWRIALTRQDAPVALVLSRQDLPIFDRSGQQMASAENVMRGAYILLDSADDGMGPELVLIGTGSEVALCLDAQQQLRTRGIRTRVVSMPSWELFDAQSPEYQHAVLGLPGTPRLAVEAGITQGWHRYVGERGSVLGISQFGASAPFKEVMRQYGFTADKVVAHALALIQLRVKADAETLGN
ncbi:MAG: transketolase [Ktedonobacteraceae bacterium]